MGICPNGNSGTQDFGPMEIWPTGGFGPRSLGLWPHGTLAPCDCSHMRLTVGERLYGNLAIFGPCFWPPLIHISLCGPLWSILAPFGPIGTMLFSFAPFLFLFVHLFGPFLCLFENNMPQLNMRSYAQMLCLFFFSSGFAGENVVSFFCLFPRFTF